MDSSSSSSRRFPPRQDLAPPIIDGRVPPHDLDAEAAVLSACMLDARALDSVLEFLKAEHFYSDSHRRIYEACVELHATGQPVDVVQLGSWLRSRERLAQVGGMTYLTQILNAVPAIANAPAYGRTIREKSRVRQLIATCQRVSAEGYIDYGDAQQFIDNAEQSIYAIARTPESSSVRPLVQVLRDSFKKISESAARGGRITGTSSGFDRLDRVMAGLHNGELTIIAARPGMGKTSFVLNLAANVAKPLGLESSMDANERWEEPGVGVVFFSLEMPREQIANRMLCSEAKVDVGKLRSGGQTTEDWRRLTHAASELGRLPVWIDDTPGISLLELRAKVRRLQAEYNGPVPTTGEAPPPGKGAQRRIGLVVIDYLQLMKGRDGVNSREQEISEISRGLKGLAKELEVPVVALSQLNRAVETRSDKSKRPMISDLRESGAIEQDADNIIFIYRDEYYNKENTTEKAIAELIVAKQRNGPTTTVKVRFDKEYTRFDNLPEGEYEEHEDG